MAYRSPIFNCKLFFLLSLVFILSLTSCSATQEGFHQDNSKGQMTLYLSTKSEASRRLSFTIERSLLITEKEESQIFLDNLSKKIESGDIINKQMLLGETEVTPGIFKGIKFIISEINLIEDEKSFKLDIPEDGIYIPYDFKLKANETVSIFLNLDVDNSIKRIAHGYSFAPRFTVKSQTPQLKGLTGYVSNKDSNNVSIVDRQSDEVLGVIAVGKGPSAMVINPGRSRLYVANSLSNNISVIDTSNNEVVDEIYNSQGSNPVDLAISRAGDVLYVANYDSNNITVVDTFSKSVLLTISVGQSPVRLALNPIQNELYVSNFNSNNISVIDTFSYKAISEIAVESNPYGLAVSSDGEKIYVINNGSTKLSVIDRVTRKKIDSLSIDYASNDLLLDNNNEIIYITNANRNNLKAFSLSVGITQLDLSTGPKPLGLALDEDIKKIFVANSGSNTISVINLVSGRVMKEIPVGGAPQRVVLNLQRG
ncbi:MAG: YncE family protein [bacterium]